MLESSPDETVIQDLVPKLRGAPYILYLARLHPGKGCDLLGEAFALIAQERRRSDGSALQSLSNRSAQSLKPRRNQHFWLFSQGCPLVKTTFD